MYHTPFCFCSPPLRYITLFYFDINLFLCFSLYILQHQIVGKISGEKLHCILIENGNIFVWKQRYLFYNNGMAWHELWNHTSCSDSQVLNRVAFVSQTQALSGDSTPMSEGMSFRRQSQRRQGMEIHLAAKTRVIDALENTEMPGDGLGGHGVNDLQSLSQPKWFCDTLELALKKSQLLLISLKKPTPLLSTL